MGYAAVALATAGGVAAPLSENHAATGLWALWIKESGAEAVPAQQHTRPMIF